MLYSVLAIVTDVVNPDPGFFVQSKNGTFIGLCMSPLQNEQYDTPLGFPQEEAELVAKQLRMVHPEVEYLVVPCSLPMPGR